MITQEKVDKLEETYNQDASWCIWEPIDKASTSNVGDMSVFEEPFLDELNSDFVLVALNRSGDSGNVIETESWKNFHSQHKGTRDHYIRHAITGTEIWGSYITDIIKKHIETDSSKVVDEMEKDNQGILLEHIEHFRKELDIIGGKPVIIAFGANAYEWIKDHFKDQYEVYTVTHYSYRWGSGFNKEVLKREIKEVLKQHKLKQEAKQ